MDASAPTAPDSIRVTLKLYATLAQYLPETGRRTDGVEVDIPASATLADLTGRFGVPPGRLLLGAGERRVPATWRPRHRALHCWRYDRHLASGRRRLNIAAVPVVRRFSMACTEADFRRLMPLAFPGVSFDPARRRFMATDGTWSLELGEQGVREIASLRLPAIEITFHLRVAQADKVLGAFFRYFQRGGG